jgi:hypothetical protein
MNEQWRTVRGETAPRTEAAQIIQIHNQLGSGLADFGATIPKTKL